MSRLPVLETPRLLLRPFALSDAQSVQALAGDAAIADTTLRIPHPYEDGMAEEWIGTHERLFESGEQANFAITRKTNRELVGAIGLVIEGGADRAELGYWVGKPGWGQGYCSEAGRAVLAFGFETLHLQRIHACFFPRNPASGRVLEKLGMIREGVLRRHVKKNGLYEDIVVCGILREEWFKEPGTTSRRGEAARKAPSTEPCDEGRVGNL